MDKLIKELAPKLIKWAFTLFFLIVGIKLLLLSKQGETWALLVGIFSFGVIYWMYNAKNTLPWQVLVASLITLIVALVASIYVPVFFPYFEMFPFNKGLFFRWYILSVGIGIFSVGYAFKEYD